MSKLDDLAKLDELKKSGAVSEAEYQKLKSEIMDKDDDFVAKISELASDVSDHNWILIMHLSQLLNFLIPLGGLIAPIAIWQIKKEEFPEVDEHGKVIANWIISSCIYGAVAFAFSFLLIGYPFLLALLVMTVVFPIIGALESKKGKVWKYPFSIQFIK